MILLRQYYDTNPEKKTLVRKTPPATLSGVNSLFPVQKIMDLRTEITSELSMG